MLQVARLAPSLLGEEASGLISEFVLSQEHSGGGFHDRDGEADLYYTSFAVDCLTALRVPLPEERLSAWLRERADAPEELDFVHLCCLLRCLSALEEKPPDTMLAPLFAELERYRSADGGYNQARDAESGSAYGAFLAWGAYADHGREAPDSMGVAASLEALRAPDGGWANDAELPVANVPATAAAVTLLRNLHQPVPAGTGDWLLGCLHPAGGFVAFPGAPLPDLLTTAVALHTLDGLQVDFAKIRESLLDYVDTLWTAEGGFHGSWEDDDLDIEYTYYGLLALGHLAL